MTLFIKRGYIKEVILKNQRKKQFTMQGHQNETKKPEALIYRAYQAFNL
jgi:hypothetical protein